MDFRQLEYVTTIAEERTLLAASEKLFLSPSALSQFISKLEAELQTPLFKRTKSGWIPTYAGQIYINMASEILEKQKKAYLQISDIAENKVGHFTVGINPGRGTLMFSKIFPKFRSIYPQVKISLFEGTVLETSEMIAAGKVDIGFLTSEFEHPNVVTQSLAREKIVMVVPRSHPMAALADHAPKNDLATVDLNLFRDDEFLLAGKQTTLRTLEDRAFAQAGFMPKIAFETPSLVTLNSLSQSGYGISFVPSFYAKQVDEAVYFHTSPPISWELVAASRKGSHITEAENYMISLAAEYYNAPPKHHTR